MSALEQLLDEQLPRGSRGSDDKDIPFLFDDWHPLTVHVGAFLRGVLDLVS
jgi:hypothetical protein